VACTQSRSRGAGVKVMSSSRFASYNRIGTPPGLGRFASARSDFYVRWFPISAYFLADFITIVVTALAFDRIAGDVANFTAEEPLKILAVASIVCSCFGVQGHYTQKRGSREDISRAGHCLALVSLVQISIAGLGGVIWLPCVFTLAGERLLLRKLLHFWGLRRPVLIIGTEAHCSALRSAIDRDWYRGFQVVEQLTCSEIRYSVAAPRLAKLADDGAIAHVVVAASANVDELSKLWALVHDLGLTLSIGYIPCCAGTRFVIDEFIGTEFAILREVLVRQPRVRSRVKRALDLAICTAGLALIAPAFLAIIFLVKRDGGPAFYASPRVGLGGKIFMALKFRTMINKADQALEDLLARNPDARKEWETTFKLRDDPRITRTGRFLRRFSLDELPQIINVIRGEMSLVGPRPLLPIERDAYGEAFELYCKCVPGITGPWQVSGRNNLDYSKRIELNSWYARNASLWVDLLILFRTIPVVLRQVGAV
jgi:Undecaprenyl-phosphate galactose phosphotransferase WbaP